MLSREEGVNDPYAGLAPGAPPRVVEGNVVVQATLTAPADSPEADDVVRRLRADLDTVGEDVLVGGMTAMNLDVRDASNRDLRVIIPAILVVIFSCWRCCCARWWRRRCSSRPTSCRSRRRWAWQRWSSTRSSTSRSDPSTPTVFLVALGIDYSIFLMTRVREELDAGCWSDSRSPAV